MYSSGTQTGLTITSQDGDNTFDFAVTYGTEPGAVSSSTSGGAGSADSASRSDHNHDLSITADYVTLTMQAHGAQGDILIYSGVTGEPTLLNAGTSGQALITGGAGADPAWGALAEAKVTFANTGGHSHTGSGATGTAILWSSIDKTTSSIADITTKSHTALSDIGSNTHAQIDTFIGTTVPAYFNTSTGHDHDASDSKAVAWASIDKATSSIADITTKSHTALSDIGTNTHAQIDTFIGTTVPAYFNTTTGHDHDGSDSKKVTYTDLASIPSTFAPSSHTIESHTSTVTDGQILVGTGANTFGWGGVADFSAGTFAASTSWAFAGNSTVTVTHASSNQLALVNNGAVSTTLTTDTSGYMNLAPSGGWLGIGCTPTSSLEIRDGLTTTGAVLTLATEEPTVVANDVLGAIKWYAPLEADGSDAILTGAEISALAEATFDATHNATSLIFKTGASEAAAEKMRITSAGKMGIGLTAVTAPAARVEIQDTSTPLRLSHTAGSFYTDFTVDGGGFLIIGANGNCVMPDADNDSYLGYSTYRWKNVYANEIGSNGTRIAAGWFTNITCTDPALAPSDERLKTDVRSIDYGLKCVNALMPKSFRWTEESGYDRGARRHGWLAQETSAALSALGFSTSDIDCVKYNTESDEYQMAPGELLPILWAAVQELSAKVTALE
jgi:uncharacterized protein YukE